MNTPTLGIPRFTSPLNRTVSEDVRIPERIEIGVEPGIQFELAGPRGKLFFDPRQTRAGIVTCGGLCPGLNDVIRSLFLQLHHAYGVKEVLGFRGGYQGLDPSRGTEPIVLTPAFVDSIHKECVTVLVTSRGPVDIGLAVANLIQREVNILFTIGGDGTQRGGNDLFQEAKKRGHALAVVGIPKTVDNDVAFVARSFGYLTAVQEAAKVLEGLMFHGGIGFELLDCAGANCGELAQPFFAFALELHPPWIGPIHRSWHFTAHFLLPSFPAMLAVAHANPERHVKAHPLEIITLRNLRGPFADIFPIG